MSEEIKLNRSNWQISNRVSALIYHNNKLLVQRTVGEEGVRLPGGEVIFGTFSNESLMRKFREETGIALNVRRLCFAVESFYDEGIPCHCLELIYLAELKNFAQLSLEPFHPYDEKGRECAESELSWVEIDSLNKIKLKPSCICPYLQILPEHTVHLCQLPSKR